MMWAASVPCCSAMLWFIRRWWCYWHGVSADDENTDTMNMHEIMIEHHPFEPFLPKEAWLLMLGTFPPAEKRWCMRFYYPNFMNDMWRIFGLCYFNDKNHFVIEGEKRFDLDRIKAFLMREGIAMYDTAVRVRRLKNTASDKDLQIVEPTDLCAMLHGLPQCRVVITAGQLATEVLANTFGVKVPKVGEHVECCLPQSTRVLQLYRMPSSSRAYPMAVEKKAMFYRKVFGR